MMRIAGRVGALLLKPFAQDGYLRSMPGPFGAWTRVRDFPVPPTNDAQRDNSGQGYVAGGALRNNNRQNPQGLNPGADAQPANHADPATPSIPLTPPVTPPTSDESATNSSRR